MNRHQDAGLTETRQKSGSNAAHIQPDAPAPADRHVRSPVLPLTPRSAPRVESSTSATETTTTASAIGASARSGEVNTPSPEWLQQVLLAQRTVLEPARQLEPQTEGDSGYLQAEWLAQVLKEQASTVAPNDMGRSTSIAIDLTSLERTGYYHAWLDAEAHRRTTPYFASAWQDFVARARESLRSNPPGLLPFVPVDRTQSAIVTVTRGQILGVLAVITALIVGLYTAWLPTFVILLGTLTLAYGVNLLLTASMAVHVIGERSDDHSSQALLSELADAAWPPYTILCPLYKEAAVVPQFVAAMQALDYPQERLQILFLTEEDDELTRWSIRSMNLPPNFQVVTVPDGHPRTKPRACNYGLLLATGNFVVIYDAEDVPDPLQLKKAVVSFASHESSLACVQAKLGFYNTRQNLLTRWFAIEYALWFHVTLPGLQWARLSLPLGGTSNHFRTDVLRRLGGWDAFNVTEDCDLGLRLAEHHFHTSILDSTTLEEANSNTRNWIRQRSRWIKGYLQTYLVHLRCPWEYVRFRRTRELLSLFAIVGGTPATFLANPVMWALLALYIAAHNTVAPEFHLLYVPAIFYPAMLCLVAGNFLYLYLYLIACAKSRQYSLMLWVITIPIYWLLMCVAAVQAVIQLIFKPHYWEKTTHGLHLANQLAAEARASARASEADRSSLVGAPAQSGRREDK